MHAAVFCILHAVLEYDHLSIWAIITDNAYFIIVFIFRVWSIQES